MNAITLPCGCIVTPEGWDGRSALTIVDPCDGSVSKLSAVIPCISAEAARDYGMAVISEREQ